MPSPVIGYEQIILPDGSPGTVVHFADGLTQTVDANHRPLANDFAGAAPPAMPQRAPVEMAPAPQPQRAPQAKGYDYSSGWGNFQPTAPGNGFAPSYADGSQHPLQGGFPRTPGGTYRGPNGGGGGTGQQQVFVPGGASAGPFKTAAAAEWPHQVQRAFDSNGRSYASRGSHRSPMYDAMRSKGQAMAGKVRGMASGAGSSGGSGGGGYSSGGGGSFSYGGGGVSPAQRQYTRDQRQQARVDKAYRASNLASAAQSMALSRGQMIGSRILAKPWDPRVVDAEYALANARTSEDVYGLAQDAYRAQQRYNRIANHAARH